MNCQPRDRSRCRTSSQAHATIGLRRGPLGPPGRAQALLAATTVTVAILGALLLAYLGPAPPLWPMSEPEEMVVAARCDALHQLSERDRCRQHTFVVRRAAKDGHMQMAGR
jgi:hypothetical protein